MAYNINRTDGTLIVTVADNGINSSATTIRLIGRNLTNYGEILNENLVQMLENFASTTSPANPMRGQLWYKTSTDELCVWNGSSWQTLSTSGGGGGDFVSKTGDSMTGQLFIDVSGLPYPAGVVSNRGIQAIGANNTRKFLDFSTSGSVGQGRRWSLESTSTIEAGGNVGSDFAISRWNDADVLLDSPLTINRASGAVTINNTLNMSNTLINNVLNPVNPQDAATKNYVDTTTVASSGDSMSGTLSMGSNFITNLLNPVNPQDAATKNYVDTVAGGGGGGGGGANVVGEIKMFAGASAPLEWLICNGSAISRTTYSDLFSIIGTTYGSGDGSTTFNIPNFVNRVGIGAAGLYPLASTGGADSTTLTAANMPAHTHSFSATTSGTNTVGSGTTTIQPGVAGGEGGGPSPVDVSNNTSVSHTHSVSGTTGSAGSGTSFTNLPPYLAVNYIIYTGV